MSSMCVYVYKFGKYIANTFYSLYLGTTNPWTNW